MPSAFGPAALKLWHTQIREIICSVPITYTISCLYIYIYNSIFKPSQMISHEALCTLFTIAILSIELSVYNF